MNSTAGGGAAAFGYRPPFTASQWQELEQQALIFKHLMAGVPIPHELLIPITRSFDAIAARFYHHPALSYCSLYGKKIDPEPGRCRRTDGKKWRCSKDAYPDSKYCERHMHRGRNRSRKPVETPQTLSQSHHSTTSSPSSTVTVLASTTANANANASRSSGIFQSFPLRSVSPSPQLHIGTTATAATGGSYGMSCRDFRYPYGVKSQVDEHSFFSEASGSLRGHGMVDSSLDNTWNLMPSHSTFPISNERSYPQLHSLANPPHQQQQHLFFGSEYDSSEHVKNEESQSLRPFFNEWPKTRDSWSDLEDDRSNRTSFSTTQLSMSIPMASSSDFSTTSSHSPNDD